MTKSVRDAAIMLETMCGHDPKDSTSRDLAVPDFEAMLTGDIRGKVIGIPKEYRMDGMPEEIETLWHRGAEMLKDAGAEIRDISLPHTKYALPTYYVIAPAEASTNLSRYDGVRYGMRIPADDLVSVGPACSVGCERRSEQFDRGDDTRRLLIDLGDRGPAGHLGDERGDRRGRCR